MRLFLSTLIFSVAIVFHAKAGGGDNDFLVCKPLKNFFDEVRNQNISYLRGPAGPPGKRGPKGYVVTALFLSTNWLVMFKITLKINK